ncbi:hypothetical protein EJB05_56866 [Eragrostis curvula]|uniref:Uncharacterized protein n=1 Tax=Eragrostis curvula TaxID=38414 RepID=A0A5J9SEZ2_9POAL|nr:hypothetical protein EJB05_56866 [Eragrostis curvula]
MSGGVHNARDPFITSTRQTRKFLLKVRIECKERIDLISRGIRLATLGQDTDYLELFGEYILVATN